VRILSAQADYACRALGDEDDGLRVTRSRSTLSNNVQRREVKRLTNKASSCKQM
jgi:hypothetical protein